jgi:DNA-binding transcriptional LysR family regulator
VNLSRHDLNLLVVLRALLEERNVTRAGERIGLSQPATSNALQRLRREFGDELLVRSGNTMELTPLARTLLAMVSDTLTLAERTYQLTSEFSPTESTRRFTVLGSDYGLSLLAGSLRWLDTLAPEIGIQLGVIREEHLRDPDATLRRIDVMVAPLGWLHGFPSVPLYTDVWVGVVDRDNDQVGDALVVDDLKHMRLVGIFEEPAGGGVHIRRQLDVLGIDPPGRISVESFFDVPLFVEHTGRLGLVPRRVVELLAGSTHIRPVSLPFEAEMTEALYWHRLADPDPGHRWLRDQLTNTESGARRLANLHLE